MAYDWSSAQICPDREQSGSMDGTILGIDDFQALLTQLDHRAWNKSPVSIIELRDVLRRAAALLCSTCQDQSAIVQRLVGIPFSIFTKQSIKSGISLWLGVIQESPCLESMVVSAIAEYWERTVRDRVGIFSSKLRWGFRRA